MPPKKYTKKESPTKKTSNSKDQDIFESLEPYNQQELNEFLNTNNYIFTTFKPVETNSTVLKCNPCSTSKKKKYYVPISNLGAHLQGKAHQQHRHPSASITNALAHINQANIELRYSQLSLDDYKISPLDEKTQIERKRKLQKQFQFQITNFLIKNNLPFNLSENLSKLINHLTQNYNVNELSTFNIDRKCVSEIASNFWGPYFQENYLTILKDTPFSLALDEGSLKGNTEYLAISARYLESNSSLLTTTKLIALIQLEGSKTGETIYNLVMSLLFSGKDGEIRKKNCMGICTDGASNMISTGNASLSSRLQQAIPHLVVIHDFCHIFNLILKDCINEHFPKEYAKIVKNICKKFTNSPKQASLLRQQMMKNQQGIADLSALSVKKFVESRWSSFHDSLKRILEIKDDLRTFFNQSDIEEERKYLNPRNILMLELLLFLVALINNYIIWFQKENSDIMEIITSLKEFIMIVSGFIYKKSSEEGKKGVLTGDLDQDFEDLSFVLRSQGTSNLRAPRFVKRTKKEFAKFFLEKQRLFDEKLRYLLKSLDQEENQIKAKNEVMIIEKDTSSLIEEEEKESYSNKFQNTFCDAAYDFLEAAIENIKRRLLHQYEKLAFFECFSMKDESCVAKIQKVAIKFTNLLTENEVSDLQTENVTLGLNWLRIYSSSKEFTEVHSIGSIASQTQKNPSFLHGWKLYSAKYPVTFKLARGIQVLPYSSASIERKFSELTDIKTLKRNRLSVENLQACLFVKQEYKDEDLTEGIIDKYLTLSLESKDTRTSNNKKDLSLDSNSFDNSKGEESKKK